MALSTKRPHKAPEAAYGEIGESRRRLLLSSLAGYHRGWLPVDLLAGVTLFAIAVPEQLATARLAGMPVVTGLYAFLAGTCLGPRDISETVCQGSAAAARVIRMFTVLAEG